MKLKDLKVGDRLIFKLDGHQSAGDYIVITGISDNQIDYIYNETHPRTDKNVDGEINDGWELERAVKNRRKAKEAMGL